MVELRAPFQAAEEGRKEDTKETAQFEHVDHAEKVLHQAEAEAEIHLEETRRRTSVEVVVDMLTHQGDSPKCVLRLKKWSRRDVVERFSRQTASTT